MNYHTQLRNIVLKHPKIKREREKNDFTDTVKLKMKLYTVNSLSRYVEKWIFMVSVLQNYL